jgi:hypothetical protein
MEATEEARWSLMESPLFRPPITLALLIMATPLTLVLSTTTSAPSPKMATSSEPQPAAKTSPESTSGQASPSKSLQSEFNALAYCLKVWLQLCHAAQRMTFLCFLFQNTVVSTGQIYDFHIKARERYVFVYMIGHIPLL